MSSSLIIVGILASCVYFLASYEFTSFLCRYLQKAGFAGPWEPATLTRRREPALLATLTRRLMKRPIAQHGGARKEREVRK